MGGAIVKAAVMGGLTKLGKKVAKENPDTKSPIGHVCCISQTGKRKRGAKRKQQHVSTTQADRAAMAAPGAVEYAGEDTDEATPRRRRRQIGRPTAGQRRSLLAEQSRWHEDKGMGGVIKSVGKNLALSKSQRHHHRNHKHRPINNRSSSRPIL